MLRSVLKRSLSSSFLRQAFKDNFPISNRPFDPNEIKFNWRKNPNDKFYVIDMPGQTNIPTLFFLEELHKQAQQLENEKISAAIFNTQFSPFFSSRLFPEFTSPISATDALAFTQQGSTYLNRFANSTTPIILYFNGPVTGNGAELALVADSSIVTLETTLCFDQVHCGRIPAFGSIHRLTYLLNDPIKAARIILNGLPLTNDELHQLGNFHSMNTDADLQMIMESSIKKSNQSYIPRPFKNSFMIGLEILEREVTKIHARQMKKIHFLLDNELGQKVAKQSRTENANIQLLEQIHMALNALLKARKKTLFVIGEQIKTDNLNEKINIENWHSADIANSQDAIFAGEFQTLYKHRRARNIIAREFTNLGLMHLGVPHKLSFRKPSPRG